MNIFLFLGNPYCMDYNCPLTFEPVCGSDGQTYPNDCSLKLASCQNPRRRITSQCKRACPCTNCAREHVCRGDQLTVQVCGSDGVEYRDHCHLKIAACMNPGQHITVKCWGGCHSCFPRPPPPPPIIPPSKCRYEKVISILHTMVL